MHNGDCFRLDVELLSLYRVGRFKVITECLTGEVFIRTIWLKSIL